MQMRKRWGGSDDGGVEGERKGERKIHAHARAKSSQNEGANYRGVVVEHGSGVVNGHGGDWGKGVCCSGGGVGNSHGGGLIQGLERLLQVDQLGNICEHVERSK
eukprot:CAMPEP_0173086070 /NCGR_PEP_ID=MMETSP1102-20130122/22384_1 /TAXON_ID=49646 /ORGANISM="Geminigera sp., Strain Caron Lab Isolate" /LENGTH=103 /DNA_ID=CAMNT_0013966241 /DNA_START=742 /DNA_END=1050 /DNA_ORIENTATION=-